MVGSIVQALPPLAEHVVLNLYELKYKHDVIPIYYCRAKEGAMFPPECFWGGFLEEAPCELGLEG